MPGNFKKKDLRVIKTFKSILNALPNLLNKKDFNKITVNDLCEEAQLSRTAFYMHFLDKYDLLKYFLKKLKKDNYPHFKDDKAINDALKKYQKIVVNLVEDADCITMAILQDFVLDVANIPINSNNGKPSNKNIILTNFCAGGIINCVLWQIKKNFPVSLQIANSYIGEILQFLRTWGEQ